MLRSHSPSSVSEFKIIMLVAHKTFFFEPSIQEVSGGERLEEQPGSCSEFLGTKGRFQPFVSLNRCPRRGNRLAKTNSEQQIGNVFLWGTPLVRFEKGKQKGSQKQTKEHQPVWRSSIFETNPSSLGYLWRRAQSRDCVCVFFKGHSCLL